MKKILIITTAIGIVAVALTMVFGQNTIPFLYTERTNLGILMYKYDFLAYFRNLQLTINDTTIFTITLPTREMIELEGGNWFEDLANDLLVIVDYIILTVNVMIYPMRVGGYIVQNVLAILGLDVVNNPEGGLHWFITFAKFIARAEIPYI